MIIIFFLIPGIAQKGRNNLFTNPKSNTPVLLCQISSTATSSSAQYDVLPREMVHAYREQEVSSPVQIQDRVVTLKSFVNVPLF